MPVWPICSCMLDTDSKQIRYPGINEENKRNILFSDIVFCKNCELGIALPEVSRDRIEEFYKSENFWKQLRPKNTSLKSFPVPYALAKSRWRDIENLLIKLKNTKDVKILDIGAGHGCIGLVANQSKRINLNLYTCVEPDLTMQQYLKDNLSQLETTRRLEVRNAIDEASGQYDIVILSHVLEHLNDPLSMLNSAIALLAPGGILLLDVPNQDYLFKKDVFPHILFFSPSTIRCMLNKVRLIEIVSIESRGSNMLQSPLNKKAPFRVKFVGQLVHIFHRLLSGRFLVIFFTWYFGINRVNSNGTWIRVLCRKKISYGSV